VLDDAADVGRGGFCYPLAPLVVGAGVEEPEDLVESLLVCLQEPIAHQRNAVFPAVRESLGEIVDGPVDVQVRDPVAEHGEIVANSAVGVGLDVCQLALGDDHAPYANALVRGEHAGHPGQRRGFALEPAVGEVAAHALSSMLHPPVLEQNDLAAIRAFVLENGAAVLLFDPGEALGFEVGDYLLPRRLDLEFAEDDDLLRGVLLLRLICQGGGKERGDQEEHGKCCSMLPLLLALLACRADDPKSDSDVLESTGPPVIEDGWYPLDDVLRLNDVQARGTHNSYHVQPENPVDASHFYTHQPLDVQLGEQGVRQFEIDVHYNDEEGFQVFHLPALDEVTTCLAFTDCLSTIKAWSDANPYHVPIMIWLEPKDEIDSVVPGLSPIDEHYDELDDEIWSVFPDWQVLTPDDVRGDHDTLPAALAAEGWPTLGEIRGRVVFSMLDSGHHRDNYIEGAENLAGKPIFVDADEVTDPYAAMFKMNDAQSDFDRVQERVAAGFMVTCNADGADNDDARNIEKRDASLASGAHFLSSDSPADEGGYYLEVPGGSPARCNPVYSDVTCTSDDIERLP